MENKFGIVFITIFKVLIVVTAMMIGAMIGACMGAFRAPFYIGIFDGDVTDFNSTPKEALNKDKI